MNWDNPEARAALIEQIGVEAYNNAYDAHIESITVAIVSGHRIFPVNTRFGRLFNVEGTGRAFKDMDMAKSFADEKAIQPNQS